MLARGDMITFHPLARSPTPLIWCRLSTILLYETTFLVWVFSRLSSFWNQKACSFTHTMQLWLTWYLHFWPQLHTFVTQPPSELCKGETETRELCDTSLQRNSSLLTLHLLLSRSGKDGQTKEYYTMECLLFLLKNVHVTHPVYVRQAAVSTVSIGCFTQNVIF